VGDEAELRTVAGTYESRYGPQFTDPDGIWFGLFDAIRGGQVLVYRVAPKRSFGFGEGKQFSQTAGDSLMAEIATTASELRCRHC
jgi:hypothetical protein